LNNQQNKNRQLTINHYGNILKTEKGRTNNETKCCTERV